MSEHRIKTHPAPFAAILDGTKRHEIRKDDRGYAVGDVLVLEEFEPDCFVDAIEQHGYTGRSVRVRVTYKSDGGTWGLPDGLCVMSIEVEVPARAALTELAKELSNG